MPSSNANPKSYYVRRVSPDGRLGWTGSIRSHAQVLREAAAWQDSGWTAEVLPNTLEVRREVRTWERAVAERRLQVSR